VTPPVGRVIHEAIFVGTARAWEEAHDGHAIESRALGEDFRDWCYWVESCLDCRQLFLRVLSEESHHAM
jgi:hypothetical protein